jgi:micrococcal nuclease
MSKPAKPRHRKSTASRRPHRRLGRDLFGVLVVAFFGLAFTWAALDTTQATAFLRDASARMQELASGLSHRTATSGDPFPVSSIGDKTRMKQGDRRRYPVCTGKAPRANCVVDGDTFYMNGTTIRISDIDAPDTHPPRCALEADLGDRATTRLSELLSAGPFQLVRHDRDIDKYGRQLRVVIRDGRSIGKMLVSEGLARSWSGKRRPWCPDDRSS